MAIEKKSLISSRTAAKKAVVARESGSQVTAGPTKAAPAKRKIAAMKPAFAPMKKAVVAPARFAPMKKI